MRFANEEFTNHVYINFIDEPKYKNIFTEFKSVENVIKFLEINKKIKIIPGKTLLLFDDVIDSDSIWEGLKTFVDDNNCNFHISCISKISDIFDHKKFTCFSLIKGRFNTIYVYPLNFMEFLLAINKSGLHKYICDIKEIKPIPNDQHKKLKKLFNLYLAIGGLPSAVAYYN